MSINQGHTLSTLPSPATKPSWRSQVALASPQARRTDKIGLGQYSEHPSLPRYQTILAQPGGTSLASSEAHKQVWRYGSKRGECNEHPSLPRYQTILAQPGGTSLASSEAHKQVWPWRMQ